MSLDRLDTGDSLCSYNGYTFGPTALTTGFSAKPNPDPAGRTVMSTTFTVTVKETIAAGTEEELAALMETAREKLERNGGKLRYAGRGFGDIDINLATGKRDVRWGPWCRELAFVPTGAGVAVEMTWTVEFTTVDCPDGLTAPGTILSFTYTVDYDIDREGYTTRRYDSSLTIAQTRKKVDDKTLSATADMHLEKMVPAPLVGFRRESQSRKLSLDKNTLTYTVVDSQMPGNLPPVGVVEGSIEHTWQSLELFKWAGSITATYTIDRRNGTPLAAIVPFQNLVLDRINEARKMVVDAAAVAGVPGGGGGGAAGGGVAAALGGAAGKPGDPVHVYLRGASATEPNVLGRTQVKLGVQYMASGCSFAEILRSGGLWKPLGPNDVAGNWKKWAASVPSVFSPRGHAALVFTPKEDALVDACIPGAKPVTQQPQKIGSDPGFDGFKAVVGGAVGGALVGAMAKAFGAPSPENSWIEYKSFVTIHPELGRVTGSTLPTSPLNTDRGTGAGWNVLAGPDAKSPSQSSPFPPVGNLLNGHDSAGGETFVHQRTRPRLYVTISGYALRGGWQIPIPELLEVNGNKPTLVGNPRFRTGITAQTQVPIVYAEWSLTYVFEDDGGVPAKSIPVPPNSRL